MPFITPSERFAFPAETFSAVDAIHCEGIRNLLRYRLTQANNGLVCYRQGALIKLDESLRLWAVFIRSARTSPVNTSWGSFDIADAPSIHAAIDVLRPILAEVRGEVLSEQKAA